MRALHDFISIGIFVTSGAVSATISSFAVPIPAAISVSVSNAIAFATFTALALVAVISVGGSGGLLGIGAVVRGRVKKGFNV